MTSEIDLSTPEAQAADATTLKNLGYHHTCMIMTNIFIPHSDYCIETSENLTEINPEALVDLIESCMDTCHFGSSQLRTS